MCRIPDAYKPRPAFLKGCVIALLSLWIVTMTISPLSSGGHSEEEIRNRQALTFGLPALAAVFAIVWFARVMEMRRRGELFLWIERVTWRRGEAISGSIELGFVDPVVDAHIRLVERRGAHSYFGEPFHWSRVADHTQGRQMLSFQGTVGMDARDSSLYMLEVRTQTMSGMRTLSGFQLTVYG